MVWPCEATKVNSMTKSRNRDFIISHDLVEAKIIKNPNVSNTLGFDFILIYD